MGTDEMGRLREVLKECADALEAEVNYTYSWQRLPDGTIRPSEQWKYDREMEPVRKARAILPREEE